MGLRFQRWLGNLGDISPGQYAVDGPCIFLAYPRCGGVDDVSVSHPPIPLTDVLRGEWKCQTATCGYATHVSLDCWNEEPHR